MIRYWILFLLLYGSSSLLIAQDSLTIIGYTYETNNRGFLEDVQVVAKEGAVVYGDTALSAQSGKFELRVPLGRNYVIEAQKQGFQKAKNYALVREAVADTTVYMKLEIERLPGYVLEASITDFFDPDDPESVSYGVEDATIEIYNNTMMREEMRLVAHPRHTFTFLLEQGNEYIFMIRKKGYYTKRMRANVNVNGCILCMEGFGTVTPGVVDNLTNNNTMGMLVTDVPMKKLKLQETVQLDNIYYDFGSAELRPEAKPPLDKLAQVLLDNPGVSIELSSHTDCRGSDRNNMILSQKRAETVVAYVRSRAKLPKGQITARGYGESKLLNSCADGVECEEDMHQINRRTEFTITGISKEAQFDPKVDPSLASIMQGKNFNRLLAASEATYVDEFTPRKDSLLDKPSPPKVIPMGYTGFKLELLLQKTNPSLDNLIFREFAEVFLDVTPNNAFSFMIGDFKTQEGAKNELKYHLKKYPDARIISYQEGIRQ